MPAPMYSTNKWYYDKKQAEKKKLADKGLTFDFFFEQESQEYVLCAMNDAGTPLYRMGQYKTVFEPILTPNGYTRRHIIQD